MGWTEVETSGTGRDKIKNKEKSDRYVIKLKRTKYEKKM